jgi:hypothetical protein
MANMNRDLESRSWVRVLIAYYGVLQCAHLGALIRALVLLRTRGYLGFPAPPPENGWTLQALEFLFGMGVADFLNILLSLYFVFLFFKTRARWGYLGIATLSVSTFSALVFAYGTFKSGAWFLHPYAYASLVILFLPVAALMIVFVIFVVRG